MVTAASTTDLAVILFDAGKGILTQSKRHAFLVSLMGIKHIILAVNRMDLVDYDRGVFERIRKEFNDYAARLDIPDIRAVPLSALKGDNVAEPSANTLWYEDDSLLHLLETIYIGSDQNLQDLRFPVQWVNRLHAQFRGFSGTVASGTLRVGEEVTVLPSRRRTRMQSIVTMDGLLPEAPSSRSVTVTLEDEIDVARGDMIVRPGTLPHVSREAETMLVWMSESPLAPGRSYWFKHASRRSSAEIQSIRYSIDVNTLHRAAEIARLVNDSGLICIAAFVAPHEAVREKVRQLIGSERFVHVHLSTPVEICRARDTTGRYLAADRGDIASFPGVTSPYEEPAAADLALSTAELARDQVVEQIVRLLQRRGFFGGCDSDNGHPRRGLRDTMGPSAPFSESSLFQRDRG